MGLNISHDKDILKPRSDNKFDNFSDNYVYTVEDFKNGIANVNIDHKKTRFLRKGLYLLEP